MRGTGEMNHWIVLQWRDVKSTGGSSKNDWLNLFEPSENSPDGGCWAARKDMSNREFNQAAAMQSELTVTFTIRTPTGKKLDSGLRVMEDEQAYEAVGMPIQDKPRRGFTEIRAVMCRMEGYGYV
jgi:SPP1 family predicted phage head-tail adaptor